MPAPGALTRSLRWMLAVAVVLVATALLVLAGNQLLALKARLAAEPVWLQVMVVVAGLTLVGSLIIVLRWLLFPSVVRQGNTGETVPDEATLRARMSHWQAAGVDVSVARDELAELQRRRDEQTTYVAVYGSISSGKSSLIRTLVPGAQADVDVIGGTTGQVRHFRWAGDDGVALVLADMPGFGHIEGLGEAAATDEASRSDLVLYVTEADLTRGEWQALEALRALDKPLVVALNKLDRYSLADREALRIRLSERLGPAVPVVGVVAGGEEEVIRRGSDGREHCEQRPRPADVRALRRVLQRTLDDRAGLAMRRDDAVFLLTARKLEGAVNAHRRDAADALVERYGRRAVIGAMAAVAPGSDLVIQGSLAAGLVRELCSLYEVSWREVTAERFITELRGRTRTATPLLLGIAGNALKAFPGVGTLAGGAVHAVAYGLLFRTAGRALVDSLEARGELRADDALNRFQEALREDMATPARGLARLALEERHTDPRASG